jgi:hypothetical protein
VLLGSGAPCQLQTLAGQEHGRTIPLADNSFGEALVRLAGTVGAIDSQRARQSSLPIVWPVVVQNFRSVNEPLAAAGYRTPAKSEVRSRVRRLVTNRSAYTR